MYVAHIHPVYVFHPSGEKKSMPSYKLPNWSKVTILENGIGQILSLQQSTREANREVMLECQGKLDELLKKQEAFWYLRSRVSDIKDGDKNTKYFHHKASQRKRRNYIHGLFDEWGGVWRDADVDIENVVTSYYQKLFTSSSPSDEAMNVVLDAIDPTIIEEMNVELCRKCSKEEVWEALHQMHPNKAPSPDGMHVVFYLAHCW